LNHQEKDRRIFKKLIRFLDKKKSSAEFYNQLILEIGKFFLGTAYAASTLDARGTEQLVINLREFDCVTFVENVVALTWLFRSQQRSFKTYQKLLHKIRYRQGRLQGYTSRLHYFSDWIHDNQMKGIVRDVTTEIGGRPLKKAISFMTTHPDLYPSLKNATILRRMKAIERKISKRSLFFVPKKGLGHFEDRIHDGDIIAITSSIEGIDIQHVGIAARLRNRIHLLHASRKEGKVILSKQTLSQYLGQSRIRSGIMVARVTTESMK
jgi:hypothetical protein